MGVMTLRAGPDQVVPFLDALGVALAHHEHDGRRVGRGVARQLGLPVLGDLAAVLGDGVDVVGQGQRHHVGVETVDDRARLLARAAVRLIDLHLVASLGLPILGEGRVEVVVQLARRVVGDVEQIDLFGDCRRGRAERGQEGGEGKDEGFHGHGHPYETTSVIVDMCLRQSRACQGHTFQSRQTIDILLFHISAVVFFTGHTRNSPPDSTGTL